MHRALWQPEPRGQVGGKAAVRVRRKFLNEVKAAINRDYRHSGTFHLERKPNLEDGSNSATRKIAPSPAGASGRQLLSCRGGPRSLRAGSQPREDAGGRRI